MKLAEIINGTREDGARLRQKFLANLPALKELVEAVSFRAKSGFINGIDGRKIAIRHSHAALNTLLQSAGSIICKRWVVNMHRILKERGYKVGVDFIQHAQIHDECVLSYSSKLNLEILTEISKQAAIEAGKQVNCRIPLDISGAIGENYAEVH